MKWKDLDFKQRAELIKLGVQSGIRGINQIRQLYDEQQNTVSDVLYQNNKVNQEQQSTGIYDKGNNYKTHQDSLNELDQIIEGIQQEIAIEQINAEQPEQFKRDRLGVRINERPIPAMIDSSKVREDLSQRYDDIRKRVQSYKKYRAYGGYTDDPPFLQRILNNDNRSVVDWENNKQKSTHKLSYAQTPEGYIVYPEVQEVNGELHDFTDPKYKHGKWDALDNAIRNNDTLRFSNEQDALKYTQEYKQKYPEYFKQFDKGGYLSNNITDHKVKKYAKGGFENPDEPPVSESTYLQQPTLNIYEQEILNYLQSNPTVEQEYSRNLAIQNITAPQSNQGVIQTKEQQNIVDKAFQRYNNFRYSHPWANGLNWTPIIGDGMDLISLAGAVNNKDYMTAGLGLGMLALPNFIEKPLKKQGIKSLNSLIDDVIEQLSPQEKFIQQMYSDELHGTGWSDNIRIKHNRRYLEPIHLEFLDNHILKRMRATNFQKDSDIEDIKRALLNVPYFEYPGEYFQKAGYPTTGGWYQPWNNRIIRNTDVSTIKVLPHEYRHLIDQYFPLNNSNKIYLNRAYKDYFTNQDLTLKDGFDKDISDEMVTTNLDTRIQLFKGKRINYDGQEMGISHTPLNVQNQFIEKASTKEILNALEHSNMYGKKFVQFLKSKGNEYIEEKIPHIKNALKKVPATIPFGLMSYKLFNKNSKEENKNGGYIFPTSLFQHKF